MVTNPVTPGSAFGVVGGGTDLPSSMRSDERVREVAKIAKISKIAKSSERPINTGSTEEVDEIWG